VRVVTAKRDNLLGNGLFEGAVAASVGGLRISDTVQSILVFCTVMSDGGENLYWVLKIYIEFWKFVLSFQNLYCVLKICIEFWKFVLCFENLYWVLKICIGFWKFVLSFQILYWVLKICIEFWKFVLSFENLYWVLLSRSLVNAADVSKDYIASVVRV
jgi:hypothetical protein